MTTDHTTGQLAAGPPQLNAVLPVPHPRPGGTGTGAAAGTPEAEPAPTAPDTRPPRLAMVDGLRLVAALSVASFHYLGTTDPSYWGQSPKLFAYPLHHAAMYGWLGVEAFFLISGFVICMSGWGRTPGQFAVSRISRLFPAYWCAILLIVARLALIPMQTKDLSSVIHPRVVLANLTMFPGALHTGLLDGVAWTLDVEARFYLLMALVLAFGATYQRLLVFCTIWLVAGFVVVETHATLADQFVLSQYTGLFVTGIVLYLMYRFGQNLLLWTMMGIAWGYQLVVLERRVLQHLADSGTTKTVSWTLCALLLTGFLALLMLATIGPLARLRWGWLITAGALTYPFYLVHAGLGVPMGIELTRHVPALGAWATMTITFVSMLLLSYAIYRWAEKPFGRLLRRQLTRGLNPKEIVRNGAKPRTQAP